MKYKLIPMPEKEKTIRALKSCWHEIEKDGDYGARCKYCDQGSSSFYYGDKWGWYCPNSPDHQCHYFTQKDSNGKDYIETINGEKVIVNIKHKHRSYDYCLFCGEPEERK